MATNEGFEAGAFALTSRGWALQARRCFQTREAAIRWMKTRTGGLQRQQPRGRVRGSIVTLGDFLTLDRVLADYEQQRKAGNPEFNDTTDWIEPRDFTPRQGQYLAFIYYYTKINRQPPAERDMEAFFKSSPSAVHQMILALEQRRLIERTPGMARSIRVLVPREQLPDLE